MARAGGSSAGRDEASAALDAEDIYKRALELHGVNASNDATRAKVEAVRKRVLALREEARDGGRAMAVPPQSVD